MWLARPLERNPVHFPILVPAGLRSKLRRPEHTRPYREAAEARASEFQETVWGPRNRPRTFRVAALPRPGSRQFPGVLRLRPAPQQATSSQRAIPEWPQGAPWLISFRWPPAVAARIRGSHA